MSSARARANASSPHAYQSTGLSACWSRYGLVSCARRFTRPRYSGPCNSKPSASSCACPRSRTSTRGRRCTRSRRSSAGSARARANRSRTTSARSASATPPTASASSPRAQGGRARHRPRRDARLGRPHVDADDAQRRGRARRGRDRLGAASGTCGAVATRRRRASCAATTCWRSVRPRVIALIVPENVRSIAVAERLGLAHERDVLLKGEKPARVYAIERKRP